MIHILETGIRKIWTFFPQELRHSFPVSSQIIDVIIVEGLCFRVDYRTDISPWSCSKLVYCCILLRYCCLLLNPLQYISSFTNHLQAGALSLCVSC